MTSQQPKEWSTGGGEQGRAGGHDVCPEVAMETVSISELLPPPSTTTPFLPAAICIC